MYVLYKCEINSANYTRDSDVLDECKYEEEFQPP